VKDLLIEGDEVVRGYDHSMGDFIEGMMRSVNSTFMRI
jgi:hypothetical protein